MKKILISLILSLIFSVPSLTSAYAQDLKSVDAVAKLGLQVKMGELTGAGSKFAIARLEGLVLQEGVLLKSDCEKIVVTNTIDPKISDIVRIKVLGQEIEASEFVGFVVR